MNWLETNYIVHFAENYVEELTVHDVADFFQTFSDGLYPVEPPLRGGSPEPLGALVAVVFTVIFAVVCEVDYGNDDGVTERWTRTVDDRDSP